MMHLDENSLNPRIVFASYYIGMNIAPHNQLEERFIYDYEIEVITDSEDGYMLHNDVRMNLIKGDIIFRRPGEKTKGCSRYNSYVICFEATPSSRIFEGSYQLEDIKSFQPVVSHILLDDLQVLYHSNHSESYESQFRQIYNAYLNPHPGSMLYMNALMIHILYHLNKEMNQIKNHMHPKADLIRLALSYIDTHLENNLSLELLSLYFELSPIYFHQLFKQLAGITLNNYVLGKRIEKAKDLLVSTNDSIKSICYNAGFHDPSYFSYAFKKGTFFTPKGYRDTYRINY
ncbi:MAG: helix-turn-helix transcriptional regulator [Vallitaleaceae bacterium]|jgi:AraC-like DNA-binding protein|nr:helix-turn-helix transcriptional regulator [Vallitaleaceae bacterium]